MPRRDDGTPPTSARPPRVLVASDLGPSSRHAIEIAVALADGLGAHLLLAYVLHVETMFHGPDATRAMLPIRVGALVALQHRVDHLRARHPATSLVLAEGDPAEQIVLASVQAGADLVVVGRRARGRGGWLRGRGVAERVLCACPVPVLVVPS